MKKQTAMKKKTIALSIVNALQFNCNYRSRELQRRVLERLIVIFGNDIANDQAVLRLIKGLTWFLDDDWDNLYVDARGKRHLVWYFLIRRFGLDMIARGRKQCVVNGCIEFLQDEAKCPKCLYHCIAYGERVSHICEESSTHRRYAIQHLPERVQLPPKLRQARASFAIATKKRSQLYYDEWRVYDEEYVAEMNHYDKALTHYSNIIDDITVRLTELKRMTQFNTMYYLRWRTPLCADVVTIVLEYAHSEPDEIMVHRPRRVEN